MPQIERIVGFSLRLDETLDPYRVDVLKLGPMGILSHSHGTRVFAFRSDPFLLAIVLIAPSLAVVLHARFLVLLRKKNQQTATALELSQQVVECIDYRPVQVI
jgi:hypothetical protein